MEAAYIRNNQRCLNMQVFVYGKQHILEIIARCLDMEAAYI